MPHLICYGLTLWQTTQNSRMDAEAQAVSDSNRGNIHKATLKGAGLKDMSSWMLPCMHTSHFKPPKQCLSMPSGYQGNCAIVLTAKHWSLMIIRCTDPTCGFMPQQVLCTLNKHRDSEYHCWQPLEFKTPCCKHANCKISQHTSWPVSWVFVPQYKYVAHTFVPNNWLFVPNKYSRKLFKPLYACTASMLPLTRHPAISRSKAVYMLNLSK